MFLACKSTKRFRERKEIADFFQEMFKLVKVVAFCDNLMRIKWNRTRFTKDDATDKKNT